MKKLKVLVTGHRGMLGTDLMAALSPVYQTVGFDLPELDVTQRDDSIKILAAAKPDLIIHTAAFTDVDGCEKDPRRAYAVNAVGTANVVAACAKLKAALVYISTDFVFDGKKGAAYLEFDRPNPLQVYGRSKLAGEFYASHLLDNFFIIRTAWLFGKHGKNFPDTILKLAEKKKELRVVNDQTGSPTLTTDLCRSIISILRNGGYGIYHATNRGKTSWYNFATAILKRAKKDTPVRPISSGELKLAAQRPAYSVLENFVLSASLDFRMPEWEDALERYLKSSGSTG